MKVLLSDLEEIISESIESCHSIQGGDICEAYQLISTNGHKYFVKHHKGDFATSMFEAEALSLIKISDAGFPTPKVFLQTGHYLVLEWIETNSLDNVDWVTFGKRLTLLHSFSNDHYGFELNGHIGPIVQNNSWTKSFYEFYINQRIEPLIKKCYDLHLLYQNDYSHFYAIVSKIEQLIPVEEPVLIHGDLWSGNYLVDSDEKTYLIDAASAFNHRGFDLGMMNLFGGFSEILFKEYERRLPVSIELAKALDLFQLYYLLIHLYLFGKRYYQSVSRILKKYS